MTRQGVQRVADLLVERGLAEYRPNPAHRRAKLLACTEAGYWAIRRISLAVVPWGNGIGAEIGADELRDALATMRRLVAVLNDNTDDESCGPRRPRDRSALLAATAREEAVVTTVGGSDREIEQHRDQEHEQGRTRGSMPPKRGERLRA